MRSIIIGEGTMPVACARLLVRRGHTILAASSPDAPLEEWSSAAGIPHARRIADVLALVERMEFEYLFSVVNYRVLPPALLRLARQGAINYHDAPLPRYAGTYATSWAILHGETEHGVTWHAMNDDVDAGDVLAQVAIPLTPLDTAGSLNHKCFFSGVHALGVLVEAMAAGTLQPRPQDMDRRSYHPFLLRPPAACSIDFQQSADEVARFVRAHSFGRSPNPFGTPKIRMGDDWVIVGTATSVGPSTHASPGTVIAADANALVVATADGHVMLGGLSSMSGVPVDVKEFDWSAGVPSRGGERMGLATTAYEAAVRDERRWLRWLAAQVPARLPDSGQNEAHDHTSDPLPGGRDFTPQPMSFSVADTRAGSVAGHARFLQSLGLASDLVVGVVTEERLAPTRELGDLVCAVVPVQLGAVAKWDDGWKSSTLETEARGLAPYATDLGLRYPGTLSAGVVQAPIVLAAVDEADISCLPRSAHGAELTVVFAPDGVCRWYPAGTGPAKIRAMFEQYLAWSRTDMTR